MAKKISNKKRIQQKAEEAAEAKKKKVVKKKKVKKEVDKEKTDKKKAVKKAIKKAVAKKEAAKKKVAKKKTAKKKLSKKAAAAAKRMKVVWKVFNANYKEVGCFSYPEKKKAYKLAEDLEKKNKGKHFVNAVKVSMEED